MDSLFTLKRTKNTLLRLSSLLLYLILSACDSNGGNGQFMQLSISTSTGGSALASNSSLVPGDSVNITLSPDDGYALASVRGCNGELNGNTYAISSVSPDCSVQVEFLPLYELTPQISGAGSISPNAIEVMQGQSTSFTVSPNAGYTIDSVTGCGGSLSGNTYTTAAITSACSISARFIAQHVVSLNTIQNGSLSFSQASNTNNASTQLVTEGEQISLNISPESGYALENVSGCNGSLSGMTYTTGAISGPCAISAVFRQQHALQVNQTSNGTISPGSSNILDGNSTMFTITPDNGYAIGSVSGCAGTLNGNTYTTGAITSPCAISAVFRQQHTLSVNQPPNGAISPASLAVLDGETTALTITPDTGYVIDSVTGCGGSIAGKTYTTGAITSACAINATFRAIFGLNASAGANGSISPTNIDVLDGDSGTFTLTPDAGYAVDSVSGCGGTLTGNTYTTAAITSACSITASFLPLHTVTASTSVHGSISPASIDIKQGDTTSFNVNADNGFIIDSVTGCGGSLSGSTYTTGAISGPCAINASFTVPFNAAALSAAFGSNQSLGFSWPSVAGAGYFRILENPDGASGFTQIGSDLSAVNLGASPSFNKAIGVNFNPSAQYILQTCLGTICLDSNPVSALGDINNTISYIKASNPESGDHFGYALAISEDGSTLAIGAYQEDSNAVGINGDDSNNAAGDSGAVYVFTKVNNNWTQQAYLKSASTEISGNFGYALSMSNDGNTLAVGAIGETSGGQGEAGAVHIFTRSGTNWSHQQRINASAPGNADNFGNALALSGSGERLVVGATNEQSNATGIDGDATNDDANEAGAAYIFERNLGSWSQQHYLKASNAEAEDFFGYHVSISDDGNTIAVGAYAEASASAADQSDNNSNDSGAVYVFHYAGSWSQQAYIKADIIGAADYFGFATSLSADGNTLAVGAPLEDSSSQGMGGDPNIGGAFTSGAAYVFTRSGVNWTQQSFIKSSNSEGNDAFGHHLSLSHSGNLLAVGAYQESSDADGIDGDQSDNSAGFSGAAYLFSQDNGTWTQDKYLKAINSNNNHLFGSYLELSGDGSVLGVAAHQEASDDANDPSNTDAFGAGAVFLY